MVPAFFRAGLELRHRQTVGRQNLWGDKMCCFLKLEAALPFAPFSCRRPRSEMRATRAATSRRVRSLASVRTALALVVILSMPSRHGNGSGSQGEPVDSHEAIAQAIIHRGEKVIRECQLSYTVDYTKPKPSEQLIHEEVESNREILSGLLERATNDDEKKMLQQAMGRLEDDVRRQLTTNSATRDTIFFSLMGPTLGGDRYFEITDRSVGREQATIEVAYRTGGDGAHLAIHNERQSLTTLIRDRRMYYGTDEPHRLGRALGRLGYLANAADSHSKDFRDHILDVALRESPAVQGHAAYRIDITFGNSSEGTIGTTTLTTVPTMGYVTPMVQDFSRDGKLLEEWVCGEYVPVPQVDSEPLWFPLQVRSKHHDLTGLETRSLVYSFRVDSISLNVPVPADRFKVRLEPGTTVADTRVSPATNYTVKKSLSLGVDDVDALAKNAAIEPLVVISRTDFPAAIPGSRWPRALIMNLVLLAALASAFWWRRRRAAAALLVMFFVPGCAARSTFDPPGSASASESPLVVLPTTLDFGTVSTSSEVRRLTFSIFNAGPSLRRASLESSCGCLVVTPASFEVGPFETVTATASLAPDGKTGLRRTRITVTASAPGDPSIAAAAFVASPIVAAATITSEWHAAPRRVMIKPSPAFSGGTVTVTAPTADWETVTISTIGRDVTWQETARSRGTETGTEVRSYRVAVAYEGNHDRGLSFTLAGRDSPVLIVPIVVSL
jgi:hypothetical protein